MGFSFPSSIRTQKLPHLYVKDTALLFFISDDRQFVPSSLILKNVKLNINVFKAEVMIFIKSP